MKECLVDGERAIVAHDQAPKVPQPADRALDDPTPLIPPQGAPILSRRSGSVLVVGRDQGNSSSSQPLSQRVAVVQVGEKMPGRGPVGSPKKCVIYCRKNGPLPRSDARSASSM